MVSLSLIGNTYFDYKVGRKIGSGGFGEIYIGTHVKTGKEYALKFETLYSHNTRGEHEAGIYKALSGIVGIPSTKEAGIVENNYYLMAIELLGPSLESLFKYCGGKFSLKTVVMVAQQLITRVQDMHRRGYIHRDLKPDNIVVGTGSNRGILYVIDFGLTKRVKTTDNCHIPYREDKNFTGTTRYSSLNAHRGIELSRRDDLESLGYTIIYLLKGKLPWQGLDCENTSDKNRRVCRVKKRTSTRSLCEGLEPEFATFLRYARNLPFAQRPDYAYLLGLFDNISKRKGFTMDYMFDWTIKKMKEEAAVKAKETPKPTPAKKEEKAPPQETVRNLSPTKRKAVDIICQHYGMIKSKRPAYPDTRPKMIKEATNIVCQYHEQQFPHNNKNKQQAREDTMKKAVDIVCQYHQQQQQKQQKQQKQQPPSKEPKELKQQTDPILQGQPNQITQQNKQRRNRQKKERRKLRKLRQYPLLQKQL